MTKRIICIILALCVVASCFAVIGAVVTVNAADYSQGFPIRDGYYTVVLTNNRGWENVSIYSWNSNYEESFTFSWPGSSMEYAMTNDFGELQFIAFVPTDCDRIIFNNGGDAQSVDTEIYGHTAYYLEGDSSPYSTETFDTVFVPEGNQPSEENPTDSTDTVKPEEDQPVLVVDSSVIKMEAGDTMNFSVANYSGKVTFESQNKNIAKVNSNGKVVALKKGKTTIIAKAGKKVLKKTIKVISNPILTNKNKALKNNQIISIKKGNKLTLKIKGKYSDINNYVKLSNKKVAKITSKVTRNQVVANTKKKGTTKLTVKINGVKAYTFKINVK